MDWGGGGGGGGGGRDDKTGQEIRGREHEKRHSDGEILLLLRLLIIYYVGNPPPPPPPPPPSSIVPTHLPSQDLFRTKIQVNCDTVKLVTITIFYSTGTVLVQGNRCPRWRDEEFSSLIKCIRVIYAFVDRVKEPELHETVTTNLRNLRLPTVSPSPGGEPGLHDVRPRCSPRPQLPRTTGGTRRSSRPLSPKSASPSAAPVPVSQPIKPTRHLVPSRATPPTTPHQQAYPVTP